MQKTRTDQPSQQAYLFGHAPQQNGLKEEPQDFLLYWKAFFVHIFPVYERKPQPWNPFFILFWWTKTAHPLEASDSRIVQLNVSAKSPAKFDIVSVNMKVISFGP